MTYPRMLTRAEREAWDAHNLVGFQKLIAHAHEDIDPIIQYDPTPVTKEDVEMPDVMICMACSSEIEPGEKHLTITQAEKKTEHFCFKCDPSRSESEEFYLYTAEFYRKEYFELRKSHAALVQAARRVLDWWQSTSPSLPTIPMQVLRAAIDAHKEQEDATTKI